MFYGNEFFKFTMRLHKSASDLLNLFLKLGAANLLLQLT